jgi:hypothetical protein
MDALAYAKQLQTRRRRTSRLRRPHQVLGRSGETAIPLFRQRRAPAAWVWTVHEGRPAGCRCACGSRTLHTLQDIPTDNWRKTTSRQDSHLNGPNVARCRQNPPPPIGGRLRLKHLLSSAVCTVRYASCSSSMAFDRSTTITESHRCNRHNGWSIVCLHRLNCVV